MTFTRPWRPLQAALLVLCTVGCATLRGAPLPPVPPRYGADGRPDVNAPTLAQCDAWSDSHVRWRAVATALGTVAAGGGVVAGVYGDDRDVRTAVTVSALVVAATGLIVQRVAEQDGRRFTARRCSTLYRYAAGE